LAEVNWLLAIGYWLLAVGCWRLAPLIRGLDTLVDWGIWSLRTPSDKGGFLMVECPKCHNQYKDHITYCVFCGLDLVPVNDKAAPEPAEPKKEPTDRDFYAESASEVMRRKSVNINRPGVPALSNVFAFLGICLLFGGFAYAIHLWPEKFSLIYGIIPSATCFPSIAAIVLGVIACCMCFAMAQIISTLKTLEYIIYQIANKD
jgi:hypothetical protein